MKFVSKSAFTPKSGISINDKTLCTEHINDYAIRENIIKWGYKGICNYCGKRRTVALYKDILPFISRGIHHFFGEVEDEGVHYDDEEQEYWGASTYQTDEMLFDEAGLIVNSQYLIDDLVQSFGDALWCEKDPYGDRERDILKYDWKEFKHVVKHRSRYVFMGSKQFQTGINGTSVEEILHEIGRRTDQLNLFKWIEPGTKFYRCRQHTVKAIPTKSKDFTAPPEDRAIYPNRMSPAGIPMFYAAFDKGTAFLETFDKTSPLKNRMSTAIFLNKEKLYLLNLADLPKVPSLFDEKLGKYLDTIIFLHSFVEDLSAPIYKDGREHIDYVPTQIITEYFRYTFNDLTDIALDGIIYPSSKNSGKNACVLFFNQSECLKNLDFKADLLTKRRIVK
ncbi:MULTISPECIES: HEPN-associated N-terminal domain-containing protein [unclassified Mucilaginibacter]|uniref:HEPN-associated N-terminal domain-containing protein n=1 Tax=unclassified Mucilaginibacter TaxID=2617802 RepID=UPI001612A768|nr:MULTISPECIES: HEPN-associated N-terminal domain-containing protein [unclassified Mucilaginibacter]MBB6233044.1 hypothetical protein [Mucilaginibacter sp. FT3.2]MDR3491217.1 HEPN-associated N-terminal domain-containing protein [Gammaproteobacteria bacterium]MDR3697174.1 HEPN-associated N-terminal domain-containing protein [Mucilaginibacter sp.]